MKKIVIGLLIIGILVLIFFWPTIQSFYSQSQSKPVEIKLEDLIVNKYIEVPKEARIFSQGKEFQGRQVSIQTETSISWVVQFQDNTQNTVSVNLSPRLDDKASVELMLLKNSSTEGLYVERLNMPNDSREFFKLKIKDKRVKDLLGEEYKTINFSTPEADGVKLISYSNFAPPAIPSISWSLDRSNLSNKELGLAELGVRVPREPSLIDKYYRAPVFLSACFGLLVFGVHCFD